MPETNEWVTDFICFVIHVSGVLGTSHINLLA